MGLSTALKTAAVARMARGQDAIVRSPSSFLDRERRWETVRGLIARAVVADPDIAFYFKGVAINNALTALQKVKALAEEALITLPGTLIPQRPLSTRKLTALAKSGRAAQAVVKSGLDPRANPWFSGQAWDSILTDMGAALNAGEQTGPRGPEAESKFSKAIADLTSAWQDFSARYRIVVLLSLGSESAFRSVAVQSSLDKTLKTLEMDVPDTRQTEYINQLAAGLSSVKTMSRDFSFTRRLLVQAGTHTFPEEFRATPIIQSSTITGFTFTEARTGLPVPPSMLNIKVQDRVLINQAFLIGSSVKYVASISGSQITLNSPSSELEIRSLEILPLASIQLNELVIRLTAEFLLDPPTQPGARRVNYLTEFSSLVAQIQKLAQGKESIPVLALNLYNLANSIDVPSTKAASAFSQLSKLPASNYPARMAQLFLLGNPLSSLLSSRQTTLYKRARQITKMLRSEGWLRAHRELGISGSLSSILTMTASSATFEGTIAELQSSIRDSSEFYRAGVRT